MLLLPGLALRSAWSRRFALVLSALCIALSSFLMLGIERLRQDVKQSFGSAVSGTDLVVGARTSPLQLVLSTLFHIGTPPAAMQWASVRALASHPAVAWVAPLSLGDSVQGQTVLGVDANYLQHFAYGNGRRLEVAQGQARLELFDAVLGAGAAEHLGAAPGDTLTLQHGDEHAMAAAHEDKPFQVRAVLRPTGTPVDRSVLVSLESIEALHLDWQAGAPLPGVSIPAGQVRKFDLRPRQASAALVGLRDRATVFQVQRWVNAYRAEPLVAVLPAAAMDELWSLSGVFEQALQLVAALVAVVGGVGLVAVLSASLDQRRHELAVLRAVGASPWQVAALLLLEGLLVTSAGVGFGAAALWGALHAAGPWLSASAGLHLAGTLDAAQWRLMAALVLVGTLSALVPAWQAYRRSVADGLGARI